MELDLQVVDIPFGAGIKEREADFLLQPPGLPDLENVDFEQAGGYRVRDGFSPLAITGLPTIPAPDSLFTYQGTLWCNTFRDGLYGRSPQRNGWIKSNESAPHPVEVRVKEALRFYEGVSEVDSTVHGGYVVIAWNVAGNSLSYNVDAFVMVLDSGTFGIVVPPTKLEDLGFNVKVCPFTTGGNVKYVAVLGVESSAGTPINGALVNLNNSPPTIGAVTQITTGVGATGHQAKMDAHGQPAAGFFNVCYSDGGANTVSFKSDETLTVVASRSVATSGTRAQAIYHSLDQGVVYVVAADDTNVKCFTLPTDYSSNGAVNTLFTNTAGSGTVTKDSKATICDRLLNGNIWVAWSAAKVDTDQVLNVQPHEVLFTDVNPTTGAQTGTIGRSFGVLLAGKAFNPISHEPHIVVRAACNISSPQTDFATAIPHTTPHSTYLLAALYDPTRVIGGNQQGQSQIIINNDPRLKYVGRFFQDRAYPQEEPNCCAYHLPSTNLISAGSGRWLHTSQVSVAQLITKPAKNPAADEDESKGADMVIFDFSALPMRYAQAGELLFTSGGMPCVFDGGQLIEAAPLVAPGYPILSITAGSAGPPANVKYRAMWVWRDDKGRIHRGPVSHEILGPGSASDALKWTFQYPPTNLDGSNNHVLMVAIFRKDSSSAVYYLHKCSGRFLHDPINHAEASNRGYIAVTDTATAVDTSNPILHLDTGELDALCPPSALDVAVAANRLFYISGEDPNQIWSSKEPQPSRPPEMSSEMVSLVAEAEDDLVALSPLDEKVLAFSRNAVFYLSGGGFTDTGLGGLSLTRISSDVGCLRRSTVAQGVFGVVFESDRGVYLIDRGLSLRYIGEAVQDDFKESVCQRTVVYDERNQVWFIFTDRILVWDYIHDAWTRFTPNTSTGNPEIPTPFTILDAVRHQTDMHLLMAHPVLSARVWLYTSAASTDDSARIVPRLITPWIKMTALQGFARLWHIALLGSNDTTGGNLTVRAYINYDGSTAVWTKQWRKIDRSAGARLQVKIHNSRQKIESIRFEITGETIDQGPFDLAAKYTLSGISLEAGVLPGIFKHLPAEDKK